VRAREEQSPPSCRGAEVLRAQQHPRLVLVAQLFSCRRLHPCVAPHSICAAAHAHGSGARRVSRARWNSKMESRIRPAKEHAKAAKRKQARCGLTSSRLGMHVDLVNILFRRLRKANLPHDGRRRAAWCTARWLEHFWVLASAPCRGVRRCACTQSARQSPQSAF